MKIAPSFILLVGYCTAQWPEFYENQVPGVNIARYEMGSGPQAQRCSAYLPTGPGLPQLVPVITFIPGYQSSINQYYDPELRVLASHGFIVIAKNLGPNNYDYTPENTVEFCLQMAYADNTVRPRLDISSVGFSCNSHGCGMTINAAGRHDLRWAPNGPIVTPRAIATSSGWQQNADKKTNRNRDRPWPDYNTLGSLQGEFLMMCGTRDNIAPCAIYGRDVVQALNRTRINLIDKLNTNHNVAFYVGPITAFFKAKMLADEDSQLILDVELPADNEYEDITNTDLDALADQEARSCYYCPPCETDAQNPSCTKWPPELSV